jgi:hypothetical protein
MQPPAAGTSKHQNTSAPSMPEFLVHDMKGRIWQAQ